MQTSDPGVVTELCVQPITSAILSPGLSLAYCVIGVSSTLYLNINFAIALYESALSTASLVVSVIFSTINHL